MCVRQFGVTVGGCLAPIRNIFSACGLWRSAAEVPGSVSAYFICYLYYLGKVDHSVLLVGWGEDMTKGESCTSLPWNST